MEATGPSSAAFLRKIAEGKLNVLDSLKHSHSLKGGEVLTGTNENTKENLTFLEKAEDHQSHHHESKTKISSIKNSN